MSKTKVNKHVRLQNIIIDKRQNLYEQIEMLGVDYLNGECCLEYFTYQSKRLQAKFEILREIESEENDY